ncbi:hypothetical protein ACFLSP_00525 [Bacteroidota bacterium]
MKLIRQILLITILCLIVATGCTQQKDPTVTMLNDRFITTNKIISPGDPLPFKWMAEKGKSDLSSFTIRINGDDWFGYPITSIPTNIYSDSAFLEGPVTQGNYAFSFLVTDTDGKIGEKSVIITVE